MNEQAVNAQAEAEHRGLNGLAQADRADEKEFEGLFEAWKRDTAHLSSTSKIVDHPAYQKIIAMGERAVTFMLRASRDRGTLWFGGLEHITKQSPACEGTSAKARREAWLKWGQEKGLIS